MRIPRSIQFAIAFIAILLAIALLVWGYASLTKGSSSTSTGQSTGLFGSLFPFSTPTIVKNILGGSDDTTGKTGVAPAVRHVSDKKVAGSTFVASATSTPLLIRYVERETGHIYETPADSLSQTRLTNTTIPAVHEALWTSASTTIMRFLAEDGHIENFAASLSTSTQDQVLQGAFLKNYTRLAVQDKNLMLGVLENAEGSTIQVIEKGKASTLYTSPLRSWVPLVGGKKLFLMSGPSGGVLGSIFDISNGRLTQVAESIIGLDARVSPTGGYLIASGSAGKSLITVVYNLKTNTSSVIPFVTLVEKCAWIKNREPLLVCAVPKEIPVGNYPNDWLLGRVHTADNLWFYDPVTGRATQAVDLRAEIQSPLDAADLVTSDDGSYVLFRDRTDSSLWSAKLTPPQ